VLAPGTRHTTGRNTARSNTAGYQYAIRTQCGVIYVNLIARTGHTIRAHQLQLHPCRAAIS